MSTNFDTSAECGWSPKWTPFLTMGTSSLTSQTLMTVKFLVATDRVPKRKGPEYRSEQVSPQCSRARCFNCDSRIKFRTSFGEATYSVYTPCEYLEVIRYPFQFTAGALAIESLYQGPSVGQKKIWKNCWGAVDNNTYRLWWFSIWWNLPIARKKLW